MDPEEAKKIERMIMFALDLGAELQGIVPDVWRYTIANYGGSLGFSNETCPDTAWIVANEVVINGAQWWLRELWMMENGK